MGVKYNGEKALLAVAYPYLSSSMGDIFDEMTIEDIGRVCPLVTVPVLAPL